MQFSVIPKTPFLEGRSYQNFLRYVDKVTFFLLQMIWVVNLRLWGTAQINEDVDEDLTRTYQLLFLIRTFRRIASTIKEIAQKAIPIKLLVLQISGSEWAWE